jgi:catechol 2,3-dioxygenase-like lactoylglutathione lyase family enzyme
MWHSLRYRGARRTDEEEKVLRDAPLEVVLLATDLAASKEFYQRKLGLEIIREQDDAVWFKCGNGSQLSVSASSTGTADEQTQASWRVDDVDAEVADLRSRGVEILEYDTPGLTTQNGIADVPHGRVAWFIDPGKNLLSVIQYK